MYWYPNSYIRYNTRNESITVKELIDLNWLSRIKPYVYSENKKNVDNINYIISDFSENYKN
jgi:hypothetical protein